MPLLTIAILILVSLMAVKTLQPIDLNKYELFMATYMSHRLTKSVAAFQREIATVFNNPEATNVVLETTRGGGKTTWVEGFALHQIAEVAAPGEDMTVVSRSGGSTGTSTKIMKHVKTELEENQPLIYDYGLRRGDNWGQDHIEVIRADGSKINFYSIGKRSSIRGGRGTVLIDDPQNTDDCKSETVIERDLDWFFADLFPVILQDQRLLFIGTPISPLSLLSTLKGMTEDFRILSFPIEDPPYSGESVWPEQYPNDFLAQRLRIMGMDRYAGEYLCDPKVSGNPVFRPEWVRHYDPESVEFKRIRGDGLYVVVGMDCAESKADQADYTAIATLGATFGEKPDVYLLDIRKSRWSCKEGAEQVFLVQEQHQQHKSVVESRVKGTAERGGDAMIEEIREREKTYGVYVNLYPVRPVKDKVSRALGIQSIVQEGRFHINKHDPAHQKLLQEMTMFTGQGTFPDDQVDAIVHAFAELKEWDGRRQDKTAGPTIVLPSGHRSEITGVLRG